MVYGSLHSHPFKPLDKLGASFAFMPMLGRSARPTRSLVRSLAVDYNLLSQRGPTDGPTDALSI